MGAGLSGAVLKSARERAALGTRMLSAAEVRGLDLFLAVIECWVEGSE
jgi:hypothetical protein